MNDSEETSSPAIKALIVSVSYTHLDVYKRQEQLINIYKTYK